MKKKALNLLIILLLGGLGGILGCQVLLPWLAGWSLLAKIDWIRQSREGITVINRTERVVVAGNEAWEEAVNKASNVTVGIIAQRVSRASQIPFPKPEILAQGTGVVVSSDGSVVTPDNLILPSAQKLLVTIGEKQFEAQIQKIDKKIGLALLKINESNLAVLPFSEAMPKLGESLFLLGIDKKNNAKFIETGTVTQLEPAMAINFMRKDLNGSPIFNLKGENVGLILQESGSLNKIVWAETIRNFIK